MKKDHPQKVIIRLIIYFVYETNMQKFFGYFNDISFPFLFGYGIIKPK